MSTTYIVATHEPPTIVCPPWCTVPAQEHIDDLDDWEGHVIHWSNDREIGAGMTARIASTATPAGSRTLDDPLSIHLYEAAGMCLNPSAALAAGKALIALAEEALA